MPTRRLRVLHALGWYFPESCGGTEVYVDALTSRLRLRGVVCDVAAPTDAGTARDYVWNGTRVYRYSAPAAPTCDGSGDHTPRDVQAFEQWLRVQRADIYHQHSWSRGCGLMHLRAAKRVGLATILTVHVPGLTCLRGTMMVDGAAPCDGRIEIPRCTRCWGAARGIPGAIAAWQERHPEVSVAIGKRIPRSRLRTALLTPALVARRAAEVADLTCVADRVVAVCRWLYDVLALNGVPRERLVYCPQGVERPEPGIPTIVAAGDSARHPLRIGFLGRWEHVKGVHILVDAVRRLPAAAPVEVVIHGLPFDADYERAVRQRAAGDPRIVFKPPLPRADVLRSLARFDVLAVPSIWLETGPLVVLEALSVGTPILGSNLGGISEIVEPGVHGTLVGPGDVIAWSNAIRALTISPPARVAPLGAALRSWDLIADDMVETYEAVAAARATATVS